MSCGRENQKEKSRFDVPPSNKVNRQINFFIMRHMWQVICKRSAKEQYDTIYNSFDMSRIRYEKFIKGEKIRWKVIETQTKGKFRELDWLEHMTGISKDIFNGDARFVIDGIAKDKWDQFASTLTKDDTEKKKVASPKEKEAELEQKEADDELKRVIKAAIEAQNRQDSNNYHFYNLCYYLAERRPNLASRENITLKTVSAALKSVTIETLENADIQALKVFIKLLKDSYDQASIIQKYRSLHRKI
jgi:hypothetical protein